jgi:hypothetical protein
MIINPGYDAVYSGWWYRRRTDGGTDVVQTWYRRWYRRGTDGGTDVVQTMVQTLVVQTWYRRGTDGGTDVVQQFGGTCCLHLQ